MDLFDLLGYAVNIHMVLMDVLYRSFNEAVSTTAAIFRRMMSVNLNGLERKGLWSI
jgi:hypothetical protein